MRHVDRKYQKGKLIGVLRVTQRETYTKRGYRWTNCLALLDDNGRWLCSAHWRTNAFRKADAELKAFGWEPTN